MLVKKTTTDKICLLLQLFRLNQFGFLRKFFLNKIDRLDRVLKTLAFSMSMGNATVWW